MRALTGKEFVKLLKRHGWVYIRTHGSHEHYERPGDPDPLSVPVHAGKTLGKGLQARLMKQAGLTDANF